MGILEISKLNKSFGEVKVLDNLNLDVPENSVFGFVGQNGAGKTTTMKIILGLIAANSGTVTVAGETVKYGNPQTNLKLGYLPDVPEFYGYMTPREYLAFAGEISGIPSEQIKKRSGELLEMTGLGKVKANRRISGFSRGMKQRLGIAQALLGEPKILICDEPTSALDPAGRKDLLDILSVARERTTVVFSTHILSDVERICDTVAILHGGKCALSGSLAEISAMRRNDIIKITPVRADDREKISHALAGAKFVKNVESASADFVSAHVTDFEMASVVIMKILAEGEIPVSAFEIVEPTLESLFMEVTQ